jgi:hypothetical protein
MKKTLLYSMAALASIALASCTGDYDDWASPQSYPQEDAAAAYGVTVAAGTEANVAMPAEDGDVVLVSITTDNQQVSGYSLNSLSINAAGQEGTSLTLAAEMVDGDVVVDATELAKAVDQLYGSRASVARTLDVTTDFAINLANGDAVTSAKGVTQATVTPAPLPEEDPEGYFLLGAFTTGNWDPAAPVWMTNEGDGIYKATVTTATSGANYWSVYMGSHFVSGDWDSINQGVIGSETADNAEQQGLLSYAGDPIYTATNSLVINGEGTFEITFDARNFTYTVTRSEAMYYLVGAMNGWAASTQNMLYTQGGNVYSYTTLWEGDANLKIWDSKSLGDWNACWGTQVDGDTSASGSLINTEANAIKAPTVGDYYTFTMDMNTQTYTWTQVDPATVTDYDYVSLIGGFNNWDENGTEVDLAEVAPHNWYGVMTLEADGELKFRANHGWDVSWGCADKSVPLGDSYYLPIGGDNITVSAGTYAFYLNDITGEWSIVRQE